MDGTTDLPAIPPLAPEFIAAYTEQARADADATGKWLFNNFGDALADVKFSPEVLLGMALSLRLCLWETRGICVHLEAGLPTGPQMMRAILDLHGSPDLREQVDAIGATVCRITCENFLWSADPQELEALAIQADTDEERLLDLVARYLANRIGEST